MQKSLFSPDQQTAQETRNTFQPPVYIGSGGWNYRDWVGAFYPPYLDKADWLTHYATQFPSVEIDGTFYSIPSESTVRTWHKRTPGDFVFTAKVPRIITHERRLRDVEDVLRAFLDRISLLGDKLGPLLLQFPPSFTADNFELLHDFLPTLPANFRFALEVRDAGWLHQRFYELLSANNIAFTITDSEYIPRKSRVTADFTYLRWIGSHTSGFDFFGKVQADRTGDLRDWATVILKKFKSMDIDIYGFFNNHYMGFSPGSIRELYRIYQEMANADE
ncbi:MAG: DUF72 domain-containing protein [Candidatus Marinimicrobia bacterium]|nr:DUF72 domain-containing protein [Candidatus Neomarinimicrobiota bacterium]MCF7827984.1 DUF72 domain-containing protein [Candidatus Neomarinimicrobiota bacterium]MCF7879261.1 DUF72 domain-containing protein [Candidatus Neomarinimicrobiota bacterium]